MVSILLLNVGLVTWTPSVRCHCILDSTVGAHKEQAIPDKATAVKRPLSVLEKRLDKVSAKSIRP